MQRHPRSQRSKNRPKERRVWRYKQEKGGAVWILIVMVNFMVSAEGAQAGSVQLLNFEQTHNVFCHMLVHFVSQDLHKVLL